MDHDMRSRDVMSFEVSELAFDTRNPRLAGFDTRGGEPEIIKMLWEMMDVEELVLSIAASGYFAHEPMIVTTEGGGNIVIEGNRRLAAVKLLRPPASGRDFNPRILRISNELRESLSQIPGLLSTKEKPGESARHTLHGIRRLQRAAENRRGGGRPGIRSA